MSDSQVVTSGWLSDDAVNELLWKRDLQERMACVLQRVFGSIGGYIVKDFKIESLEHNPTAYGELLVQWVAEAETRVKQLDATVGVLQRELQIKEAVIEKLCGKLSLLASQSPK